MPYFDDFDLSTIDILLISQYVNHFPFPRVICGGRPPKYGESSAMCANLIVACVEFADTSMDLCASSKSDRSRCRHVPIANQYNVILQSLLLPSLPTLV